MEKVATGGHGAGGMVEKFLSADCAERAGAIARPASRERMERRMGESVFEMRLSL
jgi:hypothetical protein